MVPTQQSLTKGKRARVKKRKGPVSHENWRFTANLSNEGAILHSILDLYSIEYYSVVVKDVTNLITSLVRNHGFTDGPKRYRIIKDYTMALVEGLNPENPGWLATSKANRIPSCLGENFIKILVDYLNITEESYSPKYYQVVNTILNIVRMVEGLSDPDFGPVTDKAQPIDNEVLKLFETYVSNKLSPYKYDKPEVNLWKYRFHLNKNGPNGVPKIESAHKEAISLLQGKLKGPFYRLCDEMNCTYLFDYLSALVTQPLAPTDRLSDKSDSEVRLRLLVKVPDSGFKTRIVAIVDFWSQLILEPVRDHVQLVTKRLFSKTDFRLDQDSGVARMVEFQKSCLSKEVVNGHELDIKYLKFYDISSWTDRFHRDLQKIVMKSLFTPRMAEAWGQLVVHCEWYSPDLRRTIKYGQGQGMGTNGSFDIATLTDHLFINFIYDEVSDLKGIFPSNQCYGKVGDDLWIYDPQDLIKEYYGKISLPINLSKSKGFTGEHSYAEFCSRTFLDGIDVSRISPKIINKSWDFRYIPTLLSICANRNIQLDSSSFLNLQRKLRNSEETYLDKLQDWLIGFIAIGVYEQSSFFKCLNLDYLEAGNWLSGDRIRDFLSNPILASRLLICHSIMKIVEAKKDIKNKIFENTFAMDDWGDEITRLSEDNSNLFDQSNECYGIALSAVPKQSILYPRQIIVLGRYADQRNLIYHELGRVEMDSWDISKPEDILQFAKSLERIASKSCYDDGNINYSHKRVYNTQFSIVKTLGMCNSDFSQFTLSDSDDLRTILQEIRYDELAEEWNGMLPILNIEPENS